MVGTYNIIHAELSCPRCGEARLVEVECRFGDGSEFMTLGIGDTYPWVAEKHPENGGRPEHGSTDGEGYMECEHCGKDAFLRVLVREDVITGIEVDASKPGMIPDGEECRMVRIVEVLDRFVLLGKGVVLTGVPLQKWKERKAPLQGLVSIRHGGEEILKTSLVDWELMRNCWSPHRPRALALLIGEEFAAVEIPRGSWVWAVL